MPKGVDGILRRFAEGRVGASVRELDLRDWRPSNVYAELSALGFSYRRLLVRAPGGRGYLLTDGEVTEDNGDLDIVCQEIYVHADGGMVRVFPDGLPGDPKWPFPHAIKSVLYNPAALPTFGNEAFRVTFAGNPMPRSPHTRDGMKQLADEDGNVEWASAILATCYAGLIGES